MFLLSLLQNKAFVRAVSFPGKTLAGQRLRHRSFSSSGPRLIRLSNSEQNAATYCGSQEASRQIIRGGVKEHRVKAALQQDVET